MNKEASDLALDVCKALKDAGLRIAVAESCTGGALCSCLTSIPECGAPLEQGFITYTKEAKVRALGIEKEFLDKHGVISAACAEAMATGARKQAGVDIGIGITGVAGPDTAEGKPVGLVYIGYSSTKETVVETFQFGDLERNVIREKTAVAALQILKAKADV